MTNIAPSHVLHKNSKSMLEKRNYTLNFIDLNGPSVDQPDYRQEYKTLQVDNPIVD
jgi:hypothetical protein